MNHSQRQNFVNPRILKFNVGFLLAQSAGYHRVSELDIPCIRLADGLILDYLKGDLRLSRNSRGVLVQGVLGTSVISECVRCLAAVSVPVSLEIEELFSFPPGSETVYSVEESGILDLAPLVREEVILAVPMGVFCKPDCKGLCPICGQNLNEGTCDCVSDDIDPRLAILQTFRDKTTNQ
ncbi:MAG: DUF177 domain-containing protein [Anaerolineae bacterium]|nr:DUF177 domain-containing protein [Anaerolineae bacterium]